MIEPLKTETMHVVDCHELSRYATEVLGHTYDALHARARAYEGAADQNSYQEFDTTDQHHPWRADKDPTVEEFLAFDRSVVDAMEFRYDFQRFNWLRDNTPTPDPEVVIRYLADRGNIPHGKYLIQYWW